MGSDIQKWADKAMFEAAPMEAKDEQGRVVPRVHLVSATADPLGAIAAACRMYEGKPTYSLADVTDEERRHYWEQVKKTHLKAPLEFVDLHFFIEGVTRSFTHQMVRQRTAVYAQESMRFAVKERMRDEAALPPSLMGMVPVEEDCAETGAASRDATDEQLARNVWDNTMDDIQRAYDRLIDSGIPAEDARGILPHATTTRLNYKTNLRNLLDHAGNRLCTQAQFEWRFVFAGIVQSIRTYDGTPMYGINRDSSDWQFQLIANDSVFKPVCYSLGHCPFTADFDRGCTIRERVQAGEFDQINDAEWMMDPQAGVVR